MRARARARLCACGCQRECAFPPIHCQTYTHVHITHKQTCKPITHTYTNTHSHKHTHTHMCTHAHLHIQTRTHTHINISMHMNTGGQERAITHKYIHKYPHITHTHLLGTAIKKFNLPCIQQDTATYCNMLHHDATCCNMLQHAATCCTT